ncbi:MAG TPA: biopolymer transporter ExbD [Flavisolibacter sp.]|jgi:biopolymer transport protein ExbD|nr:biopolymer transporter ExbD [Flavisolibacter sp.]
MASMDTSGGDSGHKKGPGVKKAKKLSTRVDMTPMVDLGFLLITFFIFTTTMSTPNTTRLIMPKDEKDPEKQTEVKQSGALTILMAKDNNLYYYEGQMEGDGSNFKSSTYKEIRDVIQKKKTDVMQLGRGLGYHPDSLDRDLVVVIKPNSDATYKNTVDILDEMAINNIQRFALIDITDTENQAIALTEQKGGGK